jgi:hypothetical protein
MKTEYVEKALKRIENLNSDLYNVNLDPLVRAAIKVELENMFDTIPEGFTPLHY